MAVKLALAALGLLALLASGISSTDLKAQSYSCANSGAVANPGDNPLLVLDCTTLVTARDTLAGNVQLNWSANLPIEQWEGVTVEGSPLRVVEIRLDGRYLSGRIPPELGSLTGLRVLSFRIDFLTGEIPVELTSLPELRVLDLHGNPLTGSIPPEIGRLSKLETLDLFANDLDGVIPGEMGEMTSLKRLDLGGGRLSGTIPRQLGNLKNLTVLHITHTSLTGEIPPELEGLRNLEGLSLDSNELTGNIPPELGNLPNLFSLNLQSNELTGEIPNTLTGLSKLNGLYLGENELTGEIPAGISGLTSLQSLDLRHNQLTGAIPPGLGDLPILRSVSLSNNDLSGTIPEELGNLTRLESLHVMNNRLSGPIPAALGKLPNMQNLNLANNSLTGEIPAELEGLSAMIYVSFEGNQLSGLIPSSLGKLSSLRLLDLSRNELTGRIPPVLSGLTDLQFLRLNGNFLNGGIPAELADLANLEELDVSNNWLSACIPWYLSRNPDLEITHDNLPECPRPPPQVNEGEIVSIEISDLLEGTSLEYAILSDFAVDAAINGSVWLFRQRVVFQHDGSETTTASFAYIARSGSVSISKVEPIDVTPVNDPPIAVEDTAEVDEGAELSLDASALLLNDTDVDSSRLQVTRVGDATNGSVSLVGATVTYVHDGSETIAGRFSYTVSDGEASDSAIVRVAVTPVNDPPVAAPDTVGVDEGASASIESSLLLLNDTDMENDNLRVTEVGGAVNGTVSLDGLTIVYTHDGSETVEGAFSYVVSDGSGDGTGIVRVTVAPVNDPPVATPDTTLVYEGDSVLLEAEALLLNDTDADSDSLRVEAVSDAVNGTVSLDGATITYTHDGSETAEGSFTYTASDGAASDTTIVRVAVSALNRPPVTAPDSAAVAEGGTVTMETATLLLNDVDADNDAMSVTSVGGAVNGVVSQDGATVTFEHDGSESNEARFEYAVSDGTDTVSQVVTIAVTPVNDPPVAADDTFKVDEGGRVTIEPAVMLLNDTDADSDGLYVATVEGAVNGTVSLDGTAIVFAHDGSETTEGRFAYTVSDGVASGAGVAHIVVAPVNDPPVAAPDTVKVDAGSVLSIEASTLLSNDADAENAALQVVAVGDAVNGTVQLMGTTVISEHDGSDTTEGVFAYTVSDGAASDTAIVRVEVAQAGGFPNVIIIALVVGGGVLILLVLRFSLARP